MESKVEKVGKAFIVDPNPPGMEMIPAEDLFIYVKFSAYPRSRLTYGGESVGNFNSGIEDEVHFIATKINYNKDTGRLDPPLQKTYATTDWTNIGGFNSSDTRSGGILEGFGIKSIDIKYNSSLVPTVDITFTDVRGGALFDVIKDNDRLSPYSIFFKMPYPVFNLSIKGYFGQKVDFCLHMVNWTSNFNGSTGDFEISANFLGFQQAFLNDMVLGNIIGTINTEEGYKNLNRIFEESESLVGKTSNVGTTLEDLRKSGDLNIRKIDDFFTQISKLQVESEIIKTDSNSFQTLKDLNGKLSLLKTIRSFIGGPLPKEPVSNSGGSNQKSQDSKPYLSLPNKSAVIQTSSIKDDESPLKQNYLSIRDYIVFNSINIASFKSYISTLNSIILKYKEYINSSERLNKPNNSLSDAKKLEEKKIQKLKKFDEKKTKKDETLISYFGDILSEDNWIYYIVSPTKNVNNKPEPIRLDSVLEQFYTDGTLINLKRTYIDKLDINNDVNIELFKKQVKNRIFYAPTTKLLESTNVLVADFRLQRAIIEDAIIELESVIKIVKEVVQSEINEELNKNFKERFNFNPTIGKCFEIIANNTQAMVETIYDISNTAEQNGIAADRTSILKGYETDVPVGIEGVAWPSIYQKSDKGDLTEVYIGEVPGVTTSEFPEWDFVERVFENLVGKTKTLEDITKASNLKNGLDTDNWFPLNPIDYKVNPWIKLNSINDDKTMGNELIEKFFNRVALLSNYSFFSPSTGLNNIEEYARIEAIAANKTIFSEKARKIISNLLINIESQLNNPSTPVLTGQFNLKECKYYKDFVIDTQSDIFEISEVNQFQKIGNFPISGRFSDSVEYILIDDKNVLNNSKKLFQEIKNDEVYRKLVADSASNQINKKESGPNLFYKTYYSDSNNLTTNNLYNVWYSNVGTNLYKSTGNDIKNDLSQTTLKDFNLTGGTYNGAYINQTWFKYNDTGKTEYGDIMYESKLYQEQTSNYARSLLLLSTFPFKNFKDGVLNSIFPNNAKNGARIINLPKLYLYYIGGLLWRYETSLSGSDPLKFTTSTINYSKFQTPPNEYLTKIGYSIVKKTTNTPLEDELINLPLSVKNKLINNFKNWVDVDNFNSSLSGSFERNVSFYVYGNVRGPLLSENDKKTGESTVLTKLKENSNLILLTPLIFDKVIIDEYRKNKGLKVTKSNVIKYIQYFKQKFDNVDAENNNGKKENNEEQKSDNKNTNTIKLQLYNYFKNINNKWVGADEKAFNICGNSNNKNLIDYFKFIDRGWRFIGEEATFNLKSFLTLGSNLNTSVYFFISKLLRDSNFLLQILPTYINFKSATEVAKIFQPQTTLQNNDSTGPIFCCIYVGGVSEHLDIGERSNYYFKNDGFSLTTGDIPPDLVDENKKDVDSNGNIDLGDNSLVAFRVAFGAQNQTIFKNVSLNQQEHRQTGEYFKALGDLVDKRGGTQKTYVGTDLLRIFKTRSYSCKVDAMGCMNIQPLMYFDLQNVPFFNGAYLITNVSHSITPNQMDTSFEGVRQSRYITNPSTQITADLDIDLNESSETPKIEFTNLNNKNTLYSIGVNNPNEEFQFDTNFNGSVGLSNFKNLGVTHFDDTKLRLVIDTIKEVFITNKIKSNAQVTMLLASMLSNSENLLNKEMEWGVDNKDTYVDRFPESDINNNQVKYYGNTSSTEKYLLSQPIFTSGSVNDISYKIPGNDDLKEFERNDTIENRKQEIDKKISTLNDSVPAEKTEKEKLIKEKEKLIEQENNLTGTTLYYNIFKGDAYRYRPRGYLYMIGRKQYTDLYSDIGQLKPTSFATTEVDAINVSVKVWKNNKIKDDKKTAFDYSTNSNGSATIFTKCVNISQQYKSKGLENAFTSFEKVLTVFRDKNKQPLINYFNPGP
jgi:hypothetical protein